MLNTHRFLLPLAGLGALAWPCIYATQCASKEAAQWKLLDIASEGSIALMALAWFLVILGSRPAGRATTLLAGGLAALMLGAWADVLDEFFIVAKGAHWHHLLESGSTLAGVALLSGGLLYWRREQFQVSEHLQKRERLFRDHRAFDTLTQLADADYLREQLEIERARGAVNSTVLMFDIDGFHLVNRDYGQREGDRLLQAVSHILLLNLRSTDLLCRYAGDRFAVLVPDTDADAARALADHLRRAVASLRHHTQRSGLPIQISMRCAVRNVDADPRQLLRELSRALERRMSSLAPLQGAAPAAARPA